MRLGSYPADILAGSLAERAYGEPLVHERHRHRYEVNPAYHDVLQRNGMVFSGMSPDRRLVEIVELPSHPYFVAGQFHPELKSRPTRPHPLFRDFIGAALARRAREERGPLPSGLVDEPLPVRG
jgi:CTP synthase